MKKIWKVSGVLGLVVWTMTATAWAKTVTLGIDGMTCSSCARKVEKQIDSLKAKGVEACKIDLKAQAAKVTLSENAAVTSDELKAAVKKAGYSVTQVTGF